MSSPSSSGAARASPGTNTSRIGRPPQWTVSRSRKLARLYVYTTLPIEKIIRVLEDDVFKPRKNSAQKTIHNMLDNDPRYLRPDSRVEMDKRIASLAGSRGRRRLRWSRNQSPPQEAVQLDAKDVAASDSSTYSLACARQPDDTTVKMERSPELAYLETGLQPADLPPPPPQPCVPVDDARGDSTLHRAVSAGRQTLYSRQSRRQSIVPSTTTDKSTSSVRDLKRRVSDCSTGYAKQISTLLKQFTISSASDSAQSLPAPESHASLADVDTPQPPEPEVFEAFPEPCYAVAGDLIDAQSLNCACFPAQDHGGGKCWCSIAEAVSNETSAWVLPSGELSARAHHVLNNPTPANLATRDCFGNTPLHLCAALEAYQYSETLLGLITNTPHLGLTNTAGQSFLHVLNFEWFLDLKSISSPLKQLLTFIRANSPDLVYIRDVYGRTFFHRAHSLIRSSELLDAILSPFDPARSSRRDAFGFNPLANTNLGGEGPFIPPRRGELSPLPEEGPPGLGERCSPRTSNDGDAFVAHHVRLVQIAQSSHDNPRVEDDEGRNGLHCLAEAIINEQVLNDKRVAMNTGRPLKRKYDKKDTPEGGNEGTVGMRLTYLNGLLREPPDVNHYDKQGNTVLMSFIIHLSDDQEDKSKSLAAIIETLIAAGARVEARNRRGETALMLAARLGRKIALSVLLEHNANVHIRDMDGKGILQVIDSTCRAAKDKNNLALYARLEACRVLLTGRRDWGIVQNPTVVQEWRVPNRAPQPPWSLS